MRRLFRYQAVSIWLTAGFAMAFLVYFYRADAFIIRQMEQTALSESAFNYEASIVLRITDRTADVDVEPYLKEFLSVFCEGDAVVVMRDFMLTHEAKPSLREDIRGGELCISSNTPRYPLYKGSYPTRQQIESGGRYAVVGCSRSLDVYTRNGQEYIDFNGEAYLITGYLARDAEWLVNDKAVFFGGLQDAGIWRFASRYLEDGGLVVCVAGDAPIELEQETERYERMAREISGGAFYVDYIKNNTDYERAMSIWGMEYSRVPTANQMQRALWFYVLVLIMLCFMVEFWLRLRRKELVIKRRHGFSLWAVVGQLYQELLGLACIGMGAGAIVGLTLDGFFNGYVRIAWEYFDYYISVVFAFLAISVPAVSLFSVAKMLVKADRRA